MAEVVVRPVKWAGGFAEDTSLPPPDGSIQMLKLRGRLLGRLPLTGEPFWKSGQTLTIGEASLSRHTLFLGATGTGKTTVMTDMLGQIEYQMTDDDVMIIFDSKGDFYDQFAHSAPRGSIKVLGGGRYGAISEKWNVFREILADGPEQVSFNAMEISKTLFADRLERTNNTFFPSAAADILASLLTSICWDAREDAELGAVMNNACLNRYLRSSTQEDLLAQLMAYDEFRAAGSYMEGENEQAQGVLSELHSVMREVLVGVFAEEGNFSIRQFVRERGRKILFIEYDLGIGSVLTPIYRLLIDLALKETLSQTRKKGRVFLWLDEFRLLPRLAHVQDAVNFGRSKGVCVFAAAQSIDQLYDVYGESRARSIAAGFSNIFCFRPNDEHTRNHVSGLYGSSLMEIVQNDEKGSRHTVQAGRVIPDSTMSALAVGEAVVCLCGQKPFVFHFDQ